jgi:glycosyltransferase involved in cell wall biosynthesis
MRLIVSPASLAIGGSQLNAVELAGAMARRGHDVRIFGPEGPLCDLIERLGLSFSAAPARPKVRPSPHVIAALLKAASAHRAELVHGYEWPPILEALYGPYVRRGTPVVGTIMSMGVAPFIPHQLDLVVGTEQIAAQERLRRSRTHLIEPPVDTELNQPVADVAEQRAMLGAAPDQFLIVVVSRLAHELKREGILEAIRATGRLAAELPVKLAIIGDGPARAEIDLAAGQVNAAAGREVVRVYGSMDDPRPAYAAADLAFGMGSSALRAMAFGKALIVQGERGFWQLLTPDTEAVFLQQGWYGVGDGNDGAPAFERIVRELYTDPARRAELGSYARRLVVDRFSLHRAADLQEAIYSAALAGTPGRVRTVPAFAGPAAQVIGYELNRRWARYRGSVSVDDFNALSKQPAAAPQRTHEGQPTS